MVGVRMKCGEVCKTSYCLAQGTCSANLVPFLSLLRGLHEVEKKDGSLGIH